MQTATKTAAKPQVAAKVSASKEPQRLSAIGIWRRNNPDGVYKVVDKSLYKELGMVL